MLQWEWGGRTQSSGPVVQCGHDLLRNESCNNFYCELQQICFLCVQAVVDWTMLLLHQSLLHFMIQSTVFTVHDQMLHEASPSTGHDRQPTLPEPAGGFCLFEKGVFSSHCPQVLAHTGLSDCWGLLCIIVRSLVYNINHFEVTVICLL